MSALAHLRLLKQWKKTFILHFQITEPVVFISQEEQNQRKYSFYRERQVNRFTLLL